MSGTRRIRAWAWCTVPLLLTLALSGCGAGTKPDQSAAASRATVRVAAAADLKFAMAGVAAALAQSHPEIDLTVTYGSSGTFYQQVSNGAPFDLFLSADLSYPRKLADAGLADQDDVFEYAVGRLVVWAPNESPLDPTQGMAALADPQARKVAIANPEHAPYGVAAVAAMKTAGVYEAAENKLVLGENVAQAAEFALSGNAQVGVFALSLAMSPQFKDKGRYVEVPLESYPRIDQGGIVLASAQDPAAARAVRDFLLSDDGVAILKSYGFFLPGA